MTAGTNVVLLTVDALRADHLSCQGYGRETTPTLDRLAADNLHFREAYSVSSHTREAVPALLTGRFPDEAVDDTYRLDAPTIATRLGDRGYATGAFHSNPFVSRAYGFEDGFDEFDDDLSMGQYRVVALAQRLWDKLRDRHYARAPEINSRSLSWIDSLSEDQPFFLWNHYMDVHGPYQPPGDYRSQFGDGHWDVDPQSLYKRAIDDPGSITDTERQALIDLYDGEIRYTDYHLCQFLDELERRGLYEGTLIIVTADHGDAFGEHGYYEHPRRLHEELTKVPLIVAGPETGNAKHSGPVSTLDVLPTCLDGETDEWGVSLTRITDDEEIDGSRTVFASATGEGNETHLQRFACWTNVDHCRLTLNRTESTVQSTVGGSTSLKQVLRKFALARGSDGRQTGNSESDAIVEDRLEALGYR